MIRRSSHPCRKAHHRIHHETNFYIFCGPRDMKRAINYEVWVPVSILLGLTTLFRFTDLDIAIENIFYSPVDGWVWADSQPYKFLYNFGILPGLIIAVLALVVFIASYGLPKFQKYRKRALFLVLLMVLGPGLTVNVIFKSHWGRPRPRQIEQFGGNSTHLPVWCPGSAGQGSSFPSGHAAVGFYLLAPFFFLRNQHRRWATVFLAIGVGYGLLMGLGRMIQGAHFASDVLWSGGFIYFCGLSLDLIILRHRENSI